MLNQANWLDPILVNSIGHTAALLVFGLIIVLLVQDWQTQRVRQTKLPLIAAVLALGWNVGSLIALGTQDQNALWIGFVMTASFAILSLLPAVLLQVVLQGRYTPIVLAGYAVSVVAVGLHFSELLFPSTPFHQAALVVIAAGFGLLTVIAFLKQRADRKDEEGERPDLIVLGSLLLFASSFLHFGYQHVSSPWAAEIAWHHIGIPVALVILLQDYRFLLLDTFVRFLVNFGLAAIYVGGVLTLLQKFRFWDVTHESTFVTGIALVFLCLSLVAFAHLRNVLQTWVSRGIFRRSNLEASVGQIADISLSVGSEQELLALAAQQVARHLRAEQFVILNEPVKSTRRTENPSVLFGEQTPVGPNQLQFRAEAQIPLRFSSGDSRYLVGGSRRGGRRYLSEDLDDMRRLGTAIVGQVERFRAEELKRLVSQAELRALQAQINPHFLFNALNTLYGTIDRNSYNARRMVLNLADLFRYLLQSDRAVIQLSEEVRIVQAYLEIEALRLGDRLEIEVLVSEAVRSTTIPILSIQPLVENAVKHGVAAKSGRGRVSLKAEQASGGVRISITDSGSGFEKSKANRSAGVGVGLENVRRRLLLCYGPSAALQLQSSEAGTTVSFLVPMSNTHPSVLPSKVTAK